jgi:hypothetical protein
MRNSFIIIFALVLSVGIHAQNAVLEEEIQSSESKWSKTLSLTHSDGFKEDIDSSTTISGIGTYKLTNAWSLNARQRITKVYVYDKFGGREYTWDDLRVGTRYRFLAPPSFLSSTSADLFFYLPTGDVSREVKRTGRVLTRFNFFSSLFNNRITLGYQPYGMYYFNKYKQTQEGAMNRMAILGNNIFLSVSPLDKLSFTGLVGFGQTYDELGDFQQDGRASNEGFLDLDISSTYMIMPKFSVTAGYAHSESQVKGGTFEFYAFDPEVSSWYLSTSYTF